MREVNTGFGDGLATAFELVATPAIFGFLGFLVDGKLGTKPVFMLAFALFVFGYSVWKLVAKYNADLDLALEDQQARRAVNRASASRRRPTSLDDDGTDLTPENLEAIDG